MILLLDLGNTRLKWALADGDRLIERGAFAWETDAVDTALQALLIRAERLAAAWLASVTNAARVDAVAELLRCYGIPLQRLGPPAHLPSLRLAYADPSRLGVDRWLAMRAAQRRWPGTLVVASCGSALTIDALAGHAHLGGVIAPSPARMREALLQRAPHLASASGAITPFAANTADAVESGAVLAAAALVDRLVDATAQRVGDTPRLVLTGGGSDELAHWLQHRPLIEPDLVLLGVLDAALAAPGG